MKAAKEKSNRGESPPPASPSPLLGEFMTVEDVADLLRINKSTVYRMAKAGRIPATRVGRQWRFRLSALEEFLDAGGDGMFEADSPAEEQRQVVNRW